VIINYALLKISVGKTESGERSSGLQLKVQERQEKGLTMSEPILLLKARK